MGGEVPMIQSKWGKVQKIRLFPFWGETKNLIPRLCPKDRSVRPMVIVLNDLLCWCGERWPTSASQSEARMGGGRVDSWVRAFCTPLKNQKWWWRPWWYNSQHPKGLRRHGATAAKTNKHTKSPKSSWFRYFFQTSVWKDFYMDGNNLVFLVIAPKAWRLPLKKRRTLPSASYPKSLNLERSFWNLERKTLRSLLNFWVKNIIESLCNFFSLSLFLKHK